MAESQETPGRPRLVFIDNLRTAIIVLVILHHVSVVYGANTPFYYVEPHGTATTLILALFQLLNQAWFMGAFFFLSGLFSPGSIDRKGIGTFVRERLLRLGLPFLLYTFVLNPVTVIGENDLAGDGTIGWSDYFHQLGFGPLWFVALLLIFDLGYVLLTALSGNRTRRPASTPFPNGFGALTGFVLLMALASYLLRTVLPLGRYLVGFPSLAYFPQYLLFFSVGVSVSRSNLLQTVSERAGRRGFFIALGSTVVLLPVSLVGLHAGGRIDFLGYGSWQSAVYALWDSTFSVALLTGLIVLFRRRFDHSGRLAGTMSRQSYAVYVFHIPILVFLAVAARNLQLPGILKFLLLSVVAVPVSFAIAYLVRRIPKVARIL